MWFYAKHNGSRNIFLKDTNFCIYIVCNENNIDIEKYKTVFSENENFCKMSHHANPSVNRFPTNNSVSMLIMHIIFLAIHLNWKFETSVEGKIS